MSLSSPVAAHPIGLAIVWLVMGAGASESSAQQARPAGRAPAGAVDRYGDALPWGAVLRLGTVKYRQDSPIYRIVFRPDGKQFITDGEDGFLRVWDAAQGRIIRRIDPEVGVLHDYQLTSRGHRVMAIGTSGVIGSLVQQVVMVNLDDGQVTDRAAWKSDPNDRMGAIALCPDRQYVAVEWGDGSVRVLDAWTEAEIVRFDVRDRSIEHIVFSRDGRHIAVETCGKGNIEQAHDIRIFDVAEKRSLRTMSIPGIRCDDLAFSPDGTTIAGTLDAMLLVWDVATGRLLPFYNALVSHIGYSADGRLVAGIGAGGRIGLFDLKDRRITLDMSTDGDLPAKAADAPDGKTLVSRWKPPAIPNPTTVALSPDGKTLVANGGPMLLHAWDLEARRDRFAMPEAHAALPDAAIVTPDGQTIITADEHGVVRLWDPRDGRPLKQWGPPAGHAMLILAPDGALLRLSGQFLEGKSLSRWDFGHGREPVTRPIPTIPERETLCAAGFGEDGRLLFVLNDQGIFRGWDLVENKPREMPRIRFETPDRGVDRRERPLRVRDAAFLPGGRMLAVTSFTHGMQMVEIGTGRVLFVAPRGERLVASADGKILAIAEASGHLPMRPSPSLATAPCLEIEIRDDTAEIHLVDAATGQLLRQMGVEGSEVWAMAFSPDGKTLAATSGWEHGEIHLFDVASGKEVRTIHCPKLRSPALVFLPDGKRLVSGMADGSLLVWDVGGRR